MQAEGLGLKITTGPNHISKIRIGEWTIEKGSCQCSNSESLKETVFDQIGQTGYCLPSGQ